MRAYIYQLYVLCTFVKTSWKERHISLIDFTCAFDTVGLTLLIINLSVFGGWRMFYRTIDSKYRDMQGHMHIYNFLSELFSSKPDIRQGVLVIPNWVTVSPIASEV